MKFSPLARSISLGTLAVAMSLPIVAQAAFIEDSKASLELRNFYMRVRRDPGKIRQKTL